MAEVKNGENAGGGGKSALFTTISQQ